jgi:hypothetical protein
MDALPLSEIDRLDPALDIFEDGPEEDPELVERGLHPPLPVAAGLLVWGFRLCRQARRLGLPALPVRDLPPLPGEQLLALALRLEGRSGRYSWGEKEGMLRFARARRADGEPFDLSALHPWIEGRPDPGLEDRIARFGALPPAAREAVSGGRLDLKAAARAADLPAELLGRVAAASLSFSERRRFLLQLREIGRRDRLAPGELTALAARLLEERDPLAVLAVRRFPTLSGLQERFAELARCLWKGSGVRIEPPPYFEGGEFEARFRFGSPESLKRRVRTLRAIAEHGDELFGLLR